MLPAKILQGGAGNDLIIGGVGGDVLRGGLDADLYIFNLGDNGDLTREFNEGGIATVWICAAISTPPALPVPTLEGAGILQVLQNGTDTDVYLHGGFAFRIQGVVAAAIDDTYFLFQ